VIAQKANEKKGNLRIGDVVEKRKKVQTNDMVGGPIKGARRGKKDEIRETSKEDRRWTAVIRRRSDLTGKNLS